MPRSLCLASLVVATVTAGCGASDGDVAGTDVSPADPPAERESDARANESPPEPSPAFSLDEGTMMLEPGQEGLFCRQMPVPAEYRDAFITGVDADISLGTHHIIVTFSDGDAAFEAPLCNDTASGQVTSTDASFQDFAADPNPLSVIETMKRIAFGGGGGRADVRFPSGYGKPMPRGFFESSHHVLNLTTEPMEIHGRFDIYTADAEAIEFPVGVLFANQFTISIPARSEGSVEGTMTTPEAIDLVAFMSHAHNFLTRFDMFLYRDGMTETEPIYTSTDWETPAVQVEDPPVHLEPGDGLTFRCTYRNDTDRDLLWGVADGEMCMPFAMYAYPADTPRRVPPTISVALHDETPGELREGTSGFFGE